MKLVSKLALNMSGDG